MSDREIKQCPDCGELVLEVARKCRYCGYRFDGSSHGDGSTWLSGLIGLLRPARKTETRWSLVAKWGTRLPSDERVDHMVPAQIGARRGYLVVTRDRFMFFEQGSRHTHRLIVEWPLHTILDVRIKRGLGRTLTLRGASYDLVIRGLTPRALEDLRTYFSEHSLGASAGLGSGEGNHR